MRKLLQRQLLQAAVAAVVLGGAARVQAQVFWDGGGAADQDWSAADATTFEPGVNWDIGGFNKEPDFGDLAVLNNGGTIEVTQPGEQVGQFRIGQTADTAVSPYNLGTGGVLNFRAGASLTTASIFESVSVGHDTTGTWNHFGGTVEIGDSFIMGRFAGSNGTFTMADGTINVSLDVGNLGADDFILGDLGNATGTMTGGAINVRDVFFVSTQPTSTATFDMSGGTITAGNDFVVGGFGDVGPGSHGTFTHTGGTVNMTDNYVVAIGPSSTGIVNQSGGIVNTTGTALIGERGQATYTMTGGTMDVGRHVLVAQFSSAARPAVFTQSNSTAVTADGAVFFGDPGGSLSGLLVGDTGTGTYNLNDNATFSSPAGSVQVGVFGAGRGTINQSGTSTLTARGLMVGQRGIGTYNLNGGTLNLVGSAATGGGIGEFDNLIVGRSTGTFNHNAGAVNLAESIYLGDFDNSLGTYRISGGTLDVGGDLNIGGALASNAPPDATRTGTQGQALGAKGLFIVSGSAAAIDIGGKLLANAADKTRVGTANQSNFIFEIFDLSGTSLIDVAGAADLDGAVIDIDLMAGYTPSAGNTFDLITAALFGATGTGTTQNTGTGQAFSLLAEDAEAFSLAVVPGGNGQILRATFNALTAWSSDADGAWSAAGNWSAGVPNGAGARALFGAAILAPRTVTVDAAQTVGRIDFDNANAYTLAGASAITIDTSSGAGALNVLSGSHVISAPLMLNKSTTVHVATAGQLLTASNLSDAAAGVTLTKTGAGTLAVNRVRADGLAVNAGVVEVAASGTAAGMSIVKTLTVVPGALLNMADNDLIVDYTGTSPEFALRDLVKAVAEGGASGIGFEIGGGNTVLAIAEGAESGLADLNGVTFDDTAVIGKYTYYGDANLDGQVTSDDYVAVDVGIGVGDSWVEGDFDFSGTVTSDDYVAIDVNLGQGSGSPLAFAQLKAEMIALHTAMFGDAYVQKLAIAEADGFAALVPEPSVVGLLSLAVLGRRWRRHM